MRICWFNDNRLGLVEGAYVRDASKALEELPKCLNLNRISCIYAHDYGIRFRLIALRAAALRRCKPRLWRSRSKPRNPLPDGGCD